ELPRFAGGAVGFLGYEAIHFFEPKVPVADRDDLNLPEVLFMITSSLLIFDHQLRSLKIVVNAFIEDGSPEAVYARAAESAGVIMRQLARPADFPFIPSAECELPPARSNFRCEEFERAVRLSPKTNGMPPNSSPIQKSGLSTSCLSILRATTLAASPISALCASLRLWISSVT